MGSFKWRRQKNGYNVLIRELEERSRKAEADASRYKWLVKNHALIGFASGDREPASWIETKRLTKMIDAAMSEAPEGKP